MKKTLLITLLTAFALCGAHGQMPTSQTNGTFVEVYRQNGIDPSLARAKSGEEGQWIGLSPNQKTLISTNTSSEYIYAEVQFPPVWAWMNMLQSTNGAPVPTLATITTELWTPPADPPSTCYGTLEIRSSDMLAQTNTEQTAIWEAWTTNDFRAWETETMEQYYAQKQESGNCVILKPVVAYLNFANSALRILSFGMFGGSGQGILPPRKIIIVGTNEIELPPPPYFVQGNLHLTLPNSTVELYSNSVLGTSWTYSHSVTTDTNGFATNDFPSAPVTFFKSVITNAGDWYSNAYSAQIAHTFPSGMSRFAMPLVTSRAFTNLFSGFPDGVSVITGVGGNFTTNTLTSGEWDNPDAYLAFDEGCTIINPGSAFTNNFSGGVWDYRFTHQIGAGYTYICSSIPKAGYLADLGFSNPPPGLYVFVENPSGGGGWLSCDYDEFDLEWYSGDGITYDPVKGPWLEVGQPILLNVPSGQTPPTWTQTFTP